MPREKRFSRKELSEIVKKAREDGKKVVFTNGCFDILHVGHIRLLQASRDLGDLLVVGVNSDGSVKRLKGPSRPVVNEAERAEVIAALEAVDYVVIFSEDTPVELIGELKPDIHVKGGDYDINSIPEASVIKSYGGVLYSFTLVEGHSTTEIIRKIEESTES
ncbi:MAG: D-glycero-beta-D-manno-heptose 1-phosphate adenylyltransferase [Candidatus Xenobiia bacterium LiM19]